MNFNIDAEQAAITSLVDQAEHESWLVRLYKFGNAHYVQAGPWRSKPTVYEVALKQFERASQGLLCQQFITYERRKI